jgi:predicted ATP-grasp superfamily ATP-dependent carboligase
VKLLQTLAFQPDIHSQWKKRQREDLVKPPVLVLGWIPRIVLAVARSLHRHGVPVDVADCVMAPRLRSAAVRNFVRLPYPNDFPEEFFSKLRSLIERAGYDLLIPTDDVAIAAILEHYDELQKLVRIGCPPPEITQKVLSKSCTLEAGQRCNIRVPRSVVVINSSELRSIADEIPFPWILKPAEKEKRFEEFTSCKFESLDEVTRRYPKAQKFEPRMLVQEFCEGVGVGVQVLLHQGECLAVFQHRRLKEMPHTGGVAVVAIAERPNQILVNQSISLLRELGWEGIAMVEFRMNPATGESVLIEVNGRYWGTASLPVSLGIDFPLYHWQLLHGEAPEIPKAYVAGKRWRFTVGYINRLFRLVVLSRNSNSARAELRRTLAQLPEDFDPLVLDAVLTSSDPMPAIFELSQLLQFFSSHTVKALWNRVPDFSKLLRPQKSTAL